MSDGEVFGTTSDGQTVRRFGISSGNLSAKIITYGAVVQDLRIAGHESPLVLGFERFEDYPVFSPYFGATVGRYANRIRGGRFSLDGKQYQTDQNFLGKHHLHGGRAGFSCRVWDVAAHGSDFVTLVLHDPDGTMGFPGALDVMCTYRITATGSLSVEMTATCDAPTLCNLVNHSYFNLDNGGAGDTLDHILQLFASAYLPVDDEKIPTGRVELVDGTPLDFRRARPIRLVRDGGQFAYDQTFCLSSSRGPLRQAAWVRGASSGVEMEIWTTEPGAVFYGGQNIASKAPGLGGRHYGGYAGFCLEVQVWPDSSNHPHFPQAVLRPGETYRHVSEYRFLKA